MKQVADLNYAGATLNSLGIRYRKLPSRTGEFFFCTIPSNGITFDLQYGDDDTICLWRFVGTASLSKAGMRCEYRKPSYPHTVLGLEVTNEGDVSLYAEQIVERGDSHREEKLVRMIEGYVSMISNVDFDRMII